jgi:hypothetical protein
LVHYQNGIHQMTLPLLLDPYCLVAQPSSRPLTRSLIVCFDAILGEIDVIISQAFVPP